MKTDRKKAIGRENNMQRSGSGLPELISQARKAKGLSTHQAAERAGINQSTLVRIESGTHATPTPAVLDGLARGLDLDLADLYALAGYTRPTSLPAFTPYLRSKFAGLPAEARAELEQSFRHIADKYGFDADGPAAGEDEH